MDVIVTWEDDTKNCVNTSELKLVGKNGVNGVIGLGSNVKMRYKSKWYYGSVTAIEDAKTGDIKLWTPDQRQSVGSECSDDNVPLSTLIYQSGDKIASDIEIEPQNQITEDQSDDKRVSDSEIETLNQKIEHQCSHNKRADIENEHQNQIRENQSDDKRGSDIEIVTQNWTEEDSNATVCPSDQSKSIELFEDMDVSNVDDPDYQCPNSSPTILQEPPGTAAAYHPMLQSCEISYCDKNIFNSCNRCFLFLCSEHFEENVPCTMHGNKVENRAAILNAPAPYRDIPSDQTELIQLSELGPVSPQSFQEAATITYNDDVYRPQSCEVPDCYDEVFSSCFRCNILLCWKHFEGDISCDIHQKKKRPRNRMPTNVETVHPISRSEPQRDIAEIPNENNPSNNKTPDDIATLYTVEGSSREFDLIKKAKVNKRKLAQNLRNAGQEYISPATKRVVPAKAVGAYCNIVNCQENNRQCHLFTDIDRKVTFVDFHGTGEISLKRDFILRHVTQCEPKRRTLMPEGKISRRKRSLKYFLSLNGNKYNVCRKFFLNTLAVSEKFVRNSLAMTSQSGVLRRDKRGGRVEILKQRDIVIDDTIREHINRFPRVESHYCRANSSKEYLHPFLNVKKMHRLLLDELKVPPKDAPSLTCYKKVFKSMNLGFHHPKKDQCSLCAAYRSASPETKEALKEKYDKHISEKDAVREKKDQDKSEASSDNPEIVSASFDLQQVIYLPITNEGAIFYKRQLSVYNFTIYNLANRDCHCFNWPETESKRGSSEISTAVCIFIKEHDIPGTKSISLYADGCAGQNKNSIVASALLHSINNATHLQTITLRFFAPNHGQNEGDSAHSAITYALKKAGDIFLPSQLHPIIQVARSAHPYIVRPLEYQDFKDYKELSKNIKILGLRKDNESSRSINWTEVVEFKVDRETPTTLYYKTSHTENTYRSITVKRTQAKFLKQTTGQLNDSQVKINKPKYDDLMSLCTGDAAIIRHREFKNFYINLPHGH